MKRIWIGLGLLAFLMILGMGITEKMDRIHEPLSHQLQQAMTTSGWENAIAFGNTARSQWEKSRHFIASVSDHQEVDQIDTLFAQLEIYSIQKDPISHAATCAHLEEAITALQEAHRLTWWNLL